VLVSLEYWRITRYVRGAMVFAFGVLSHWFLDFVTHRPDMPLCPGGLKLGLGLWSSLPATVAVGSHHVRAGHLALPRNHPAPRPYRQLCHVSIRPVLDRDVYRGAIQSAAAADYVRHHVGRFRQLAQPALGLVVRPPQRVALPHLRH